MTSALERGEWSAARPSRTLLPGKTRYLFYWRLDGPQDRSGVVRKISPPPEFDPLTFQPVVNRYTDWATKPTVIHKYNMNIIGEQGKTYCKYLFLNRHIFEVLRNMKSAQETGHFHKHRSCLSVYLPLSNYVTQCNRSLRVGSELKGEDICCWLSGNLRGPPRCLWRYLFLSVSTKWTRRNLYYIQK
jgi:hypothetical protein